MGTVRFFSLACLASVVFVGVSPAAGATWWNSQWRYQRELTIPKADPTKLPGSDIATVTFPTGGMTKPDASDIRVATESRKETPCRVLMAGPGDQVRLAFAIVPGVTKYYAYYGNPKALPRKKLDIRRGVLLETWAYKGGIPRTLAKAKTVFDRVQTLVGRNFQSRIFLGFNPFGPASGIASIFTGYVNCTKSGSYTFACMSRNASFLLVDDKLLLDNGGTKSPNRRVYKTRKVNLSPGLHKLTFLHVNGFGDPVAVVAWQGPGENRLVPVPPGAFAPVVAAKAGPMRRYGTALDIDFIPEHVNEAFMNNRYFQRYRFEALTTGTPGRSVAFTWDFGDGQKSTRGQVDHVYLVGGQYTVTLSAKTRLGELKRTNRIYVTRDWEKVTRSGLDSVKTHAKIVAGYDLTAMSGAALAMATDLFKRAGDTDSILRAGHAFVALNAADRKEIEFVVPFYATALVGVDAPDRAVAALLKGAGMNKSAATRAMLTVQAGRIALDSLNDTARAQQLFSDVTKKYAVLTTSKAVREARIGMGDVWRARGDYDRAVKAYAAARGRSDIKAGRAPIVKGDLARHVEDYLRKRDLLSAEQYLGKWEDTFPEDKLEGYWSTMAVRLAMVRKQYAAAVREIEVLVRVHPGSNYAAELLMMSVDLYGKLREPTKAKAALRRIAEKYPESPLAAVAARKLGERIEPEAPDRTNQPAPPSKEGKKPPKGG